MELCPGVVGFRRDCEHLGGWALGAPFGPRLPRIGPAGQIHSHEFEKGIPALQTLSGSSCSEADFQKAAFFRLQQSAGNGLWMSDSMHQSGGTLPEDRDQADPQRTGTPQNHVSGGNVWPALMSRGHLGAVWLEFWQTDPMWSICWHPVHLFTSGGRVALGTSDLPGSAPSSSLVPPPSLCSLLPVRPSP